MKREIKFRARITEDGKPKMFYQENQYLISFLRRVSSLLYFEKDDTGKVDRLDTDIEDCLDRYTGLKDRNGKEIYEGDIVKNNDDNWEIFFDEGAYRLRQVGKNGKFLLMGEPRHSEIIGNIYENPELLK